MKEHGFRAFLSGRLGARSVDSYVSYCRRIERDLGINLETADLTELGLTNMRTALRRQQIEEKSLSNCLAAVRSYAAFARR